MWHGRHHALAEATAGEVAPSYVVAEKVRLARRLAGAESGFLREHAPGPYKITLTGVTQPAQRWFRTGTTEAVYPDWRALRDDLLDILRQEVVTLVAEGAAYVQLDSLAYVIQLAPGNEDRLRRSGMDPASLLGEIIASDNAALAPAREAGVTTALHMCRGNNRSSWATEGSYERIAEQAFDELQVDRLLLEYDTERAGGFEPLRFAGAESAVRVRVHPGGEHAHVGRPAPQAGAGRGGGPSGLGLSRLRSRERRGPPVRLPRSPSRPSPATAACPGGGPPGGPARP
jgi:methionine synthase II (cobalamin-independent)